MIPAGSFLSLCLGAGELSLEVASEHVQRHVWFVRGHFVSRTADRQETQLGVLPGGEVASGLAVDGVRLPHLACDLVPHAPDPVLSADRGADRVIVTGIHQDIQTKAAVDKVLVVGHHGVVAIRLLVAAQLVTTTNTKQ